MYKHRAVLINFKMINLGGSIYTHMPNVGTTHIGVWTECRSRSRFWRTPLVSGERERGRRPCFFFLMHFDRLYGSPVKLNGNELFRRSPRLH